MQINPLKPRLTQVCDEGVDSGETVVDPMPWGDAAKVSLALTMVSLGVFYVPSLVYGEFVSHLGENIFRLVQTAIQLFAGNFATFTGLKLYVERRNGKE